jgi:hypothetical protein
MSKNKHGIRLDQHTVNARLTDQVGGLYTDFAGLVKGGTVVIAATVALQICTRLQIGDAIERMFYFTVSISMSLIPLITYRTGVLLSTGYVTFRDYLFPTLMGVTEIALFVVLGPDADKKATTISSLGFQPWWFTAIALNALSAVGLVSARLHETHEEDYAPALRELYRTYRGWLVSDRVGAIGVCLIAASTWAFQVFPDFRHFNVPYVGWRFDSYLAVAGLVGLVSLHVCALGVRHHNEVIWAMSRASNAS